MHKLVLFYMICLSPCFIVWIPTIVLLIKVESCTDCCVVQFKILCVKPHPEQVGDCGQTDDGSDWGDCCFCRLDDCLYNMHGGNCGDELRILNESYYCSCEAENQDEIVWLGMLIPTASALTLLNIFTAVISKVKFQPDGAELYCLGKLCCSTNPYSLK